MNRLQDAFWVCRYANNRVRNIFAVKDGLLPVSDFRERHLRR